ncbi:hypothetical protein BDW74DRAFT_141889 [Aspergillus multicolor]|uniref:GIY-YIG nuclease family protein n=1 Tax=Aspergillus multicolor TaxID=41759 RepID=UPI003CCE515B
MTEDPATSKRPGIYLHIIWDADNVLRFWLYVGQAVALSGRIREHKRDRKKRSALHYYVWNAIEARHGSLYTPFPRVTALSLRTNISS